MRTGSGLASLFAAERIKISSTRLWWLLGLALVVLVAAYSALYAVLVIWQASAAGIPAYRTFSELASVFHGGNSIARVLALVLGVTLMGDEYRHRTLAASYLAAPTRTPLLLAKVASASMMGLAFGVVVQIIGVAVAVPFVRSVGAELRLGEAATWASLGFGVLSIWLWTLLGLGLAFLMRSMALPLLVGIGFAYVIEPVLSLAFLAQDWNLALNLMPTGATNALLGITNEALLASANPFPAWLAALVLAAWCLIPGVIGAATTVRRDV